MPPQGGGMEQGMTAQHKALIRMAEIDDSRDILEIYAPYVSKTAITFTSTVPTLEQVVQTMLDIKKHYPYLVCVIDDKVVGFAYAGRMRMHEAYVWNAELSVYLDPDFHGHGIATAMYTALFQILKSQGFCNVYALITIPNEASVALHKHFGFIELGVDEASGYKLGQWRDVLAMKYQLPGACDPATHGAPLRLKDLNKNDLATAMAMAATLL
jgi:phosphinothricin acetyltransferase